VFIFVKKIDFFVFVFVFLVFIYVLDDFEGFLIIFVVSLLFNNSVLKHVLSKNLV
jgi:hypothetical protein